MLFCFVFIVSVQGLKDETRQQRRRCIHIYLGLKRARAPGREKQEKKQKRADEGRGY